MKKILLILILSFTIQAKGQECEPCGERTLVNFQEIEWLGIQKPEDSVLLNEWNKLPDLWHLVNQRFEIFFEKGSCLFIKPSFRSLANSTIAKNNKYNIYGIIVQGSSDYTLRLWMHPACSNKVIAETEVHFQLYPFFDIDKIATQAANHFVPQLQNTYDFEMNERKTKNFGLGGDLSGGKVNISIGVLGDKSMVKGQVTEVYVDVRDCDGVYLQNKEITTEGTKGGVFIPAKFTTDAAGAATVKFKMLTDKTAILKVACETKNVWGCQDLYTGSEVIKGIGGDHVKVEISYKQFETQTLKRATIPGVKIKGGETAERSEMEHYAVLFHFPSPESLKKGYLINVTENKPFPGSRTEYVSEYGWFFYRKSNKAAKISVQAGNTAIPVDEEKGEEMQYTGTARLEHPSEIFFFKGDANIPPQFGWTVQYPADSPEEIASGSVLIEKGQDGVKWTVNKITDPKSIYKTEYLLELQSDAAEELKKAGAGFKKGFGFDIDDLTTAIDPSNPQKNMVTASGYQKVIVRILSPYPD